MLSFPWVSFLLLLLACAVFGWVLSTVTEAFQVWIIAGSFLLLMDAGLTAPLTLIEVFFGNWLTSDKRAFVTVLVFSFGFVFALTWLEIFVRVLVLLAAGTLFRLDLQRAKFRRWQALTILLLTCVIGYAIGIFSHEMLTLDQPIVWLYAAPDFCFFLLALPLPIRIYSQSKLHK